MLGPQQQWHQELNQSHAIGEKPKVKKKQWFIVLGVVVLFFGGLGIYDLVTDPDIDPGDCVVANPDKRHLSFSKAKCTAQEATYVMAEDQGECYPGDYVTTVGTSKSRSKKTKRSRTSSDTSCFYLNVREGDCLKPHKYDSKTISDRVPCSGGGAESKVVKVIDGRSDKKLCRDEELSQAYTQPAKTVCLQEV